MKRLKKLDNGLTVISFTLAELSACLNYAMANGKEYPLKTMGLTYDGTDTYAPYGYTELFNYDAFGIDDDTSYPILQNGVPEVTRLVIALDEMQAIATIRVSLGKKHIQFFYLHGESHWCILWKRKDEWYFVAGTEINSPASTLLDLTSKVFAEFGRSFIGLQIIWYGMNDRELGRTNIESRHDDHFTERKPRNRKMADIDVPGSNSGWPKIYYMTSLRARLESLLGVI